MLLTLPIGAVLGLALGLFPGCAGEPPPPAAAPEPAAEAPPPKPPEPPAPEPEPEPEAAAAPKPPPEPEPTAPTRPASEIITEADTDFLFDDSASALKEAARQKCEGDAANAGDPKLVAACMQKERNTFSGDVLSFQGAEGVYKLIIYKRSGSRLDEVYRVPVSIKEQNPTTVLVTPTPKTGKGARPFYVGQKDFTVVVPDNYTLIIEDPMLGKLVYRAKVGVVAR